MHKQLTVPHLPYPASADFNSLSAVFDTLPVQTLTNESWPGFTTSCNTVFSIFHTGDRIAVKFYVANDYFKSSRRPVNGPVNKDNCVELFISFSGDAYYNIEFNCLGNGKVAYGTKRTRRTFLSDDTVRKIQSFTWTTYHGTDFSWEMILTIPLAVFEFEKCNSLGGVRSRGNFYKCGDDLPQPHFLSWSRIENAIPNFHLQEFFGDIIFA